MTTRRALTAVEEILLAASDLAREGHEEFSEWDLTIAVWKRDRNKFGCRGYEEQYPDHKRVMMEIMSRKKRDNPLRRGWMEKTRPNHYRISLLGAAQADTLRQTVTGESASVRSPERIYDAVARYVNHRVFKDYCRDSDEPRTWLGAEAFLGIARNDATHVEDTVRRAESAVEQAASWIKRTGRDSIRRGAAGSGITIRERDLCRLRDFVALLKERFKAQFDAILRQSK